MGLLNKVTRYATGAVVSASTTAVKSTVIKKTQIELQDITNKYDECYLIIGKRIAEFLRNGETVDDPKVNEAFKRILVFDKKKAELEETIRNLVGEQDVMSEAQRLADIEREVEEEVAKCKQLLDMGVDCQDEYDRKIAVLQNRVDNFKRIEALDKALSTGLITEMEYRQKKAAILSEAVTS